MRNKKEYAYCQSYARTSAVLPDMGQAEKGRGESHEWAKEPVAVDNKQSNKYKKKCITTDNVVMAVISRGEFEVELTGEPG